MTLPTVEAKVLETTPDAIGFRHRCRVIISSLPVDLQHRITASYTHDRLGSGPVDRHRCEVLWESMPFTEILTPMNAEDRARGFLIIKKPGDGTFCIFQDGTAADTIHRLLTIFLGKLVFQGDRAKAAIEAHALKG